MSDAAGYLLRGGVLLTQDPAQPVLEGDLLVQRRARHRKIERGGKEADGLSELPPLPPEINPAL